MSKGNLYLVSKNGKKVDMPDDKSLSRPGRLLTAQQRLDLNRRLKNMTLSELEDLKCETLALLKRAMDHVAKKERRCGGRQPNETLH